ncbi:hypothetical protein FQZ97_732670 [compost metagenome]
MNSLPQVISAAHRELEPVQLPAAACLTRPACAEAPPLPLGHAAPDDAEQPGPLVHWPISGRSLECSLLVRIRFQLLVENAPDVLTRLAEPVPDIPVAGQGLDTGQSHEQGGSRLVQAINETSSG